MNPTITFTKFTTLYESEPLRQRTTWTDMVDWLSTFKICDDASKKNLEMLFSGAEWKKGVHQRKKDDVETVHLLVLDFDGDMLLEDAKKLYNQYEYVLYTSYNHQREKDGKPACDKFRMVFPLATPVCAKLWNRINNYVLEFAPGVDEACKKIAQTYTRPVVRTGQVGLFHHNKGTILDITGWPQIDDSKINFVGSANPINRSEHKLFADDTLETKGGMIRVGDITKHITGVKCPFHGDTKPGEFASMSKAGNIFLHCRKCGTVFMDKQEPPMFESFYKKVQERPKDKIDYSKPIFEMDAVPVAPHNRQKRQEMLLKRFKTLPSKYNLIYAAEGFGKSYLAAHYAKTGTRVIFGAASNKQAAEQAASFERAGLNVQLVTSREYNLWKNHNIECVHNEQTNPWEGGSVNEKASKRRIKVRYPHFTDAEVEALWSDERAADPDWDADVIVTTHARIQVWAMISAQAHKEQLETQGATRLTLLRIVMDEDDTAPSVCIPPNTTVFFDDPSRERFTKYAPYNPAFDVQDKHGNDRYETIDIGERKYFVRPEQYVLGHSLRTKVVFTTTELVTRELIVALYGKELYAPDGLTTDGKVLAGDIRVYSTTLVHKKFDGILACMVERLKRKFPNVNYFADGQGNEINLANNKGRNDLSKHHSIIEISQPHLHTINHLCDELGWSESENFAMKVAIALDTAHQAIGRNSGYRNTDGDGGLDISCTVLIDPKLFREFVQQSRYFIHHAANADTVGESFSSFMSAIDGTASIHGATLALLANARTYLTTEKYFLNDAIQAIKTVGPKLQSIRRGRIQLAIANVAEKWFKGTKNEVKLLSICDGLTL